MKQFIKYLPAFIVAILFTVFFKIVTDKNNGISATKNYNDTIYVHDTVAVDYGIIQKKGLDSMIKPYLIQYYKAGWIDALNSAIDLYNKENFNAHDVYSERDKYWRKMENQVNSK
jgi:hypothetical protein